MFALVLAIAVAAALAWWSWRDRLGEPRGRAAAFARATGIASLLLLLFDPGIAAHGIGTRPIVLLDNSVSMHAAGGRADEARRLAASLGDTVPFGELAPGEPGGRSALAEPLAGAVAAGRAVIVVTDGEISDSAAIPPDLLAQSTVHVLPRRRGPDIALVDVRAPTRLAADDTLWVEIEALRSGGAPDTANVAVRTGNAEVLHGVLRFGGTDRARIRLAGPLPHGMRGDEWFEIARVGAPDAEPGDDVRWWRVVVTPTPGIVVLAASPDWDARFLYRTLKDVADAPVRGYAQLERGRWRRMDDLKPVATADVTAAARAADILAVRGDIAPWRTAGHARLLWPGGTATGDWYVSAGGASPIAGAFAGVEPDSLPPATAVLALTADPDHDWIGATAKRARRGAAVPMIVGHADATGRTVTIAADGLFRWAFRGGVSDQVWRTVISDATTWLLGSPDFEGAKARPVTPVTQRGRAVRFHWTGQGAPTPVAIHLTPSRTDTLRFDGNGDAALALPVGTYSYTLDGGGTGSFAVEPYSDELVPAPVTLAEHAATVSVVPARRSLREMWWLFAVAIAGFGAEWLLRRRMGMR